MHIPLILAIACPPCVPASAVPGRPIIGAAAPVAVRVARASVPQSPDYPNEPPGFSRIAEAGFTSVPPNNTHSCSGYGIIAGCWYRSSDYLTVVNDSTAPVSHGPVLQYTWPQGLSVGTSAGRFSAWSTVEREEYSKVYESGWIKLPGANFEAPEAGMKLLGYWGVGEARDAGRVANEIYSVINGGIRSAFNLDIRQQNQVGRSMPQNVNRSAQIVCGRWVHYEILMTLNDIGWANGTLKVWLNGALTHDYRDVKWRTPSAPSGFWGRRWDPIWGGMGRPPAKTRLDVMEVDHVYISGVI
jgi:hypothetical protein